ncbi:MAG: PorP/SprF family type IX secretion system membrane protein [Bacteroidota bacterium]
MKQIFPFLFCCLLLLHTVNCFSQDFHLSQYEASPLYLNPSMTGMFNGYYRAHAHYRNQWASVASPFVTTSASFDMPYKEFGIGALILNDRAGAGNYNVLNFVISGAYDMSIGKYIHHHLSFGAQVGFIHKSVNMDKLSFHNQYTYTNNLGFDPGLPTGEVMDNTSIFIPEMNASMMYYYSNDMSRVNPYIGFSVFHLTQPNESFLGNTNKLPRRYVIHAGSKVNITPTIQVEPRFLAMNQKNAKELNMTIIVNYYYKAQDIWLFGGPTYRFFHFSEFNTSDAVIANIGLKYGNYIYRFSYDINTSSLSSISKGKGGFEFSVTYIRKAISPPKPACPRL